MLGHIIKTKQKQKTKMFLNDKQ